MSIDHRAEAEKHLATASRYLFGKNGDVKVAEVAATIGQSHAALVRNEGQTASTTDLKEALHSLRRRFNDTRSLVSVHIAQGLASRDKDRWKAALELTKALDEADCNLDDLVDARLEDDGWDPRSAYKTPASLVPSDDPWAATPDITGAIPERVRRVVAGHLAEMLLDPAAGEVQKWARGIHQELKHVGADLSKDIERRVRDLTLGPDPSEPPF